MYLYTCIENNNMLKNIYYIYTYHLILCHIIDNLTEKIPISKYNKKKKEMQKKNIKM